MNINEATNLPELPERYRWYLYVGGYDDLIVSIQRKGWVFWRIERLTVIEKGDITEENKEDLVLEKAEFLYKRLFVTSKIVANLAGKYPPKKLG